jgi:hypothetical protein
MRVATIFGPVLVGSKTIKGFDPVFVAVTVLVRVKLAAVIVEVGVRKLVGEALTPAASGRLKRGAVLLGVSEFGSAAGMKGEGEVEAGREAGVVTAGAA